MLIVAEFVQCYAEISTMLFFNTKCVIYSIHYNVFFVAIVVVYAVQLRVGFFVGFSFFLGFFFCFGLVRICAFATD